MRNTAKGLFCNGLRAEVAEREGAELSHLDTYFKIKKAECEFSKLFTFIITKISGKLTCCIRVKVSEVSG